VVEISGEVLSRPGTLGKGDCVLKIRDIVNLLESRGWRLVRTRGSHRQYQHALQPGTVTIAGKPSRDLYPEMIGSILKQAGLTKKDLP
jgi:predicted RNA binding protein YcfA (HicA-like mRNA interferase family)